VYDDLAEQGQYRFDLVPEPFGQVLARGVGQARDLVEVIVVEAPNDRVHHFLDVAVIDEIAFFRIDFPFDDDIEPERVAVETAALVVGRKRGEVVRRLEMKLLDQPDVHGSRGILGTRGVMSRGGGPAGVG